MSSAKRESCLQNVWSLKMFGITNHQTPYDNSNVQINHTLAWYWLPSPYVWHAPSTQKIEHKIVTECVTCTMHMRAHTHTHHMSMQVVCYLANKLPRVMGHAATAGVPKIAMQLCHSSSASQSTLCSSFIIWLLTQSLGVCVVPWHPCNSIHVLLQWSLTKTMSLRT